MFVKAMELITTLMAIDMKGSGIRIFKMEVGLIIIPMEISIKANG